jgi:hypothetical protein
MNHCKRYIAVVMLILVLCFSVFADGQIPTPGATAPLSPMPVCADGQIPTPGIDCSNSTGPATVDSLTTFVLDLFSALRF